MSKRRKENAGSRQAKGECAQAGPEEREEKKEESALIVKQNVFQRFLVMVPAFVWVVLLVFATLFFVFSLLMREMVTGFIAFTLVILVDRFGGKKLFRRYNEQEAIRRRYYGISGEGELDLEQRNLLRKRLRVDSARRRHDNYLIQQSKKVAKKTGADYRVVLEDLKAREIDMIMKVAESDNEVFDRKHSTEV